MKFRMLGPLEVVERGQPIALGGPRQRAVLALLLVNANRVVSTDRLIDDIWGHEPPEAARNALQSYVSRLRRELGDERIAHRPPGYVLRAQNTEIDAVRFEALVAEARRARADDTAAALALVEEALALWRGRPFADLADDLALQAEISRLEDERLAAVEERLGLLLDAGRHVAAVPELERLVEEHPLRERLWVHLMLALYRSGRQAEALEAFRRARGLLIEELGIEPRHELQRLHTAILRHDPELELGGASLRGYRILEQLGEGAYGAVYRAEQTEVGRDVAIKVIRPELADDPTFVRRFEAEAQTVARIEHPHVVPLYDYWREPGAAYLVMRWLRGGSLRDRLREGPLSWDAMARVFEQAASGLAAAHRIGVVHRDVKPSNILLDEDGNAYLADFGIAVDAGRGCTEPESESESGSPYTAPELERGEPPTLRTDVFGLGVTLHESVAGSGRERSIGGTLGDVVARATAADPAERYADARELALALQHALSVDVPETEHGRNPYKGLRAFEEADAEDFFGRETLVERLLDRLREESPVSRFVAVVGASGSGKSSAVRAGLLPRLRAGAVPRSESWFLSTLYPGAHPLEELEAALLRVAINPPVSLIEQLERDELGLLRAVKRSLPDDESELVLVVDQLEELFNLAEDEGEQALFLDALGAAVLDPRSRLRVVITLRADFFDRPLERPVVADLLRRGTEAIGPLTPEELERAILEPARRAGTSVEPSLVAAIAADSGGQAGALPLVQFALTELFDARAGGKLTLAAYRQLGGIGGAVTRRADALFEGLDQPGREAVRQIFLRLVSIEEDVEGSRRRVPVSELSELELDEASVSTVLDLYGRHRLLTFDRSTRTRRPTVEIAHDALLGRWGRLRSWIGEAGDSLRLLRGITRATDEWEASGHDEAFLLRGSRLAAIVQATDEGRVGLTAREHALLDTSSAAEETIRAEQLTRLEREASLERRSARHLRLLVLILGAGGIVAIALGLVAFAQKRDADENARLAAARELAAASSASLTDDPERAILLALAAADATTTHGGVIREAEEALHVAVASSRIVEASEDAATVWQRVVGKPLPRPGAVLARARDGAYTATAENGVVVRDASGRVRLRLGDEPFAAAFSPDGAYVAAAAANLLGIWSLETRKQVFSLTQDGHVRSVEFNRDGTLLATGGDGGSAHVWDVRSGREILRLHGLASRIVAVAFSPDGARVAATNESRRVLVWDVTPGGSREVATLATDALSVGFDPTGARLATASGDEGAILWDAETGARMLDLAHPGEVFDVAFTPDGGRLATAAADGVIRVFDAGSGDSVSSLRGHTAPAWGVAFGPDGRLLASGAEDARAFVWDITTGRHVSAVRGHTKRVYDVAFSSDGRLVASAGDDGRPRVWDARSGALVLTLEGHSGTVFQVDFSPDGRRIATSGMDGTARLYDSRSGEQLTVLRGHSAIVLDVMFSPDGTRVATASADGTVRLWDPASSEELLTLTNPSRAGFGRLAFTPDGSRLAVAQLDGSVRVLLLDPRELVELARSRVTRALTEEECERYLHRPCPGAVERDD